jgi:hypothetical protein
VLQEQQHVPTDDDRGVFVDEQQKLNRIFQTELQNLLLGVGAAAVCFGLLRTARVSALSAIFGDVKARALLKAKEEAKQVGTEGIQNRVGTKRSIGCENVMFSGLRCCPNV